MIDKNIEATKDSRDIINQLAVVVRSVQIHDPQNMAVLSAIERFITTVNPLVSPGNALTLELIGEFFYINGTRVRYPMEHLLNFDSLIREFRRRRLGSIIIENPITIQDMQGFLRAFISSAFSSEPFNALSEGITHIDSLRVGPLQRIKEAEEFDVRKLVKRTYFNAVSYIKDVVTQIKAGGKVSIKRAKRIVEIMVDLILQEEELLVGMTAIKDYDEYTYHHSVNVSILSIAMGQRLGLSRRALTELGLAALFHDIGKMEIPAEILTKPTRFTEDDWKIMKRHPSSGVREILKLRGLDNISLRAAIVAFEHHLNYNLSGYPEVSSRFDLDFYSRIVTLADRYDAMTSARVYARIPMAPDKALSVMMEKAGTELDPLLFKFFINMVGVFPIGTLVLLDTKELGLVCRGNTIFPDKPMILLVTDSNGNRSKGAVVDLTEKDQSGRYLRSIVKTLDPNKYRINLAEYLM